MPRRESHGVERLRDRADLIDLHEDRVADARVDAALEALRVRDEEVVTDELDALAESIDRAWRKADGHGATATNGR